MNLRYRPEIDGLRALAIIPVVLFHAEFELFSGGFVGVDVFFVISGYLITSIILTEHQNQKFSILKFYERRVRRIIPALFFVIFCSIIFAWFFLLPNDMKEFNESTLAVTIFLSNFYFWDTQDYFSTNSTLIPFFHTWSLAVEEQFYIFFPLTLIVLFRLRQSLAFWLFGILGLISLFLSELYLTQNPETGFYLLHARIWELIIGVLAAMYLNKKQIQTNNYLKDLLSFVGLLCILFSIFTFGSDTPFPGFYALIPTLGTLLLILYADPNNTITGKLLSIKFIVSLGLISYSTYLWHQPVFAFARHLSATGDYITSNILSSTGMCLLSILSFILGFVSWKFIESPFRYKKNPTKAISTNSTVLILSTAFFFIFSFSLVGYITDGYKSRVSNEILAIQNYKNDINPNRNKCHSSRKKYLAPSEACVIGNKTNVIGVLLGDSHADALVVSLEKELLKKGIGLKQMTYGGCPPITKAYRSDARNDRCHEFFSEAYRIIEETDNLSNVVLHARWSRYYPGAKFTRGVTEIEYGGSSIIGFYYKGKRHKFSDTQIKRNIDAAYKDIINTQIQSGKNIILIYPVPYAIWDPPSRYATLKFRYGNFVDDMKIDYNLFVERNKYTYEVLDSIHLSPNLKRIYPANYLCKESDNKCNVTKNNILFYKDHTHLSSDGVKLFVPEIIKSLKYN